MELNLGRLRKGSEFRRGRHLYGAGAKSLRSNGSDDENLGHKNQRIRTSSKLFELFLRILLRIFGCFRHEEGASIELDLVVMAARYIRRIVSYKRLSHKKRSKDEAREQG